MEQGSEKQLKWRIFGGDCRGGYMQKQGCENESADNSRHFVLKIKFLLTGLSNFGREPALKDSDF